MECINGFHRIVHLQECESTSLSLRDILNQMPKNEAAIVYTDFQTRGRGQTDQFWESEGGKNSLFSFNVFPKELDVHNQFYLSAIIALSIHDFLKRLLPLQQIHIKWPNDIYVNNRKIAGILIENSTSSNRLIQSSIGIGINVNQLDFGELPLATSLTQWTQKQHDTEVIMRSFFYSFNNYLAALNARQYGKIKEDYLKLLYQKDELKKYSIHNNIVEGIIRGIDEFGFLQLETNNVINSYDIKEVVYCH